MIQFVHRDSKFNKRLNTFRKSGKKAAIAADQAEKIVDSLIKGISVPSPSGVRTKHGEYRIRNCLKYDLGGGYRLITVRQDDHLFLLYIGTHDECDRWLENNRGWQPLSIGKRNEILSVQMNHPPHAVVEPEPTEDDNSLYFMEIEEKYLRKVFRGLCGGG